MADVGRPRGVKSPEEMWQHFEAYKKSIKDNPRIKVEYVGKDGDRVETPLERPLTIEGFKNYCADNVGEIQAYWINRDGAYSEFSPIITRIKEAIRQEQLEGGMVGQYNSNLTARINGLTEKTENKHEIQGPVKITMNLNK
jgi:hypothetical protein